MKLDIEKTTEEKEEEVLRVVPETSTDLPSALGRIAVGAGRKSIGSSNLDICTITPELGYSFNGTVYTKVSYPFGINATVSASLLRTVLNHLTDPEINETNQYLTIKNNSKIFKLSKLPIAAQKPQEDTQEKEKLEIQTSWLRRAASIVPNISGPNVFAGIVACTDGYIGFNRSCMVYVKAYGPTNSVIIPKETLGVLPNSYLTMYILCRGQEPSLIRIDSEDGSVWHSLLLNGRVPDWKGVLEIETDRCAVVNTKSLLDSLETYILLCKYGTLEVNNNVCSISYILDHQGLSADGLTDARTSFETTEPATKLIKLVLDMKELYLAMSGLGAEEVELRSTKQADRLIVVSRSHTGDPQTHMVFIARAGTADQSHAES